MMNRTRSCASRKRPTSTVMALLPVFLVASLTAGPYGCTEELVDALEGCETDDGCAFGRQCVDGTCRAVEEGEGRGARDAGDTPSLADSGTPDIDAVDDVQDIDGSDLDGGDVVAVEDAEADGDDVVSDSRTGADGDEVDGAGDVEPDAIGPTMSVEIREPAPRSTFGFGDEIAFDGTVLDEREGVGSLLLEWDSDLDGTLHSERVEVGESSLFSSSELSPGIHRITLSAFAEDGSNGTAAIDIGVCTWEEPESFDAPLDLSAWRVYGDGTRDERGWLELTGNMRGRKGAIFNVAEPVREGDVSIRFRISTGQCPEPGPCAGADGADGFAMSVFEVANEEELAALIAAASTGGGLGYAVAGDYGDASVFAFHIEFDTWFNRDNGDTERHTDPTEQDHVAVTLNGDPEIHHLWAPMPELEDNEWHDVIVDVEGSSVRVRIDGETVIDGVVPGLVFKGGFIGFTGTTGYFTNYHRIDELSILQSCRPD